MREQIFHNEGDVKAAVKKLLSERDWMYRMPMNNGFGQSGTLDFACIKLGMHLAIETKFGKREPTAQQHSYARDLRLHGAPALLVNEHRLTLLARWLDTWDANQDLHALTAALSSGLG